MQKLLITGPTGFVASRMAQDLRAAYRVTAMTHSELDITDPEACRRAVAGVKPDAVLHFAAISRIDVCDKDPALARRVNVVGTQNIARACQENGAALVYASSDQVYTGLTGEAPHREDEGLSPTNVYARTKVEAEQLAASLCERFYALRLTWMFDLPVRFCASSLGVVGMCMRALLHGEPVRAAVNDHRGMTYVREVIENIPALLAAPCGVYNYGSPNFESTYAVCRRVFERFGASGRASKLLVPFEAEAPQNLMIDDAKQRAANIRFSPTMDAVDRMFAEYRLSF